MINKDFKNQTKMNAFMDHLTQGLNLEKVFFFQVFKRFSFILAHRYQ